jgi:hypothetical protein
MRKMFIAFIVISNLLVIASVVLAFTDINFRFINTSSFTDKLFSWLVFMLIMFLALVVLCICVYCVVHFWEPGNAFIVILLTALGGFLVFALPAEVIDKYFDGIGTTPLPVLFYVFFAVFFSLDLLIVGFLLLGAKNPLTMSAIILKLIPALAAMIVLSLFITVYGYSAILYLQAQGIDATAKVFVTIGNVIYFLVFLIVPMVGMANFYVSDKES